MLMNPFTATRIGKVSSLTRRVNKVRKIIADQGSRTDLKILQTIILHSIAGIKKIIKRFSGTTEFRSRLSSSQGMDLSGHGTSRILHWRNKGTPGRKSRRKTVWAIITDSTKSRNIARSRVSNSNYSVGLTTARARKMSRKAQLDALKASEVLQVAKRQIQWDQQAARQRAQQTISWRNKGSCSQSG